MPVQPRLSLLHLVVLGAVALAGCVNAASRPAGAPALGCRLEAVPPLTAGGPVRVRLTLTNRGESPVWALRWNTPFEGRWQGTPFTVSTGGREVPYEGPMVKRGDPGREEYVEIAPGASAEATADLAEAYALAAPGRYRVEGAGGLHDLATSAAGVPRPRNRHQPAPLDCAAVELTVTPPG
ncbi:MAG TPA: protease [Thermoanaerobaculia bacterium]|nr:protease [Thermoanaerobaculia bacterium]